CEIVSVSSGPMWMNWDEVQQAVQPSHGTSDPRSPRIAPCISTIQVENSPASRSGPLPKVSSSAMDAPYRAKAVRTPQAGAGPSDGPSDRRRRTSNPRGFEPALYAAGGELALVGGD